MYQLLFKNRFHAMIFVAITLFSVRILIGTPDDRGAIENASAVMGKPAGAQAPAEQADSAPAQASYEPAAEPQFDPGSNDDEVVMGFASDEDLIDDAQGFDPVGWSPDEDQEADEDF